MYRSHIELHDVRWVVGKDIQETFDQLREEWFGNKRGLHIDSYMRVNYIDGYSINLKPKEKHEAINKDNDNKLWFVNIGGYLSNQLLEQHHFGLVIAKTSSQAKKKAKTNWLKNTLKIHNDDTFKIDLKNEVDNCYSIKQVNGFEIELVPDEFKRSQLFIPDWFGYMKIDKY